MRASKRSLGLVLAALTVVGVLGCEAPERSAAYKISGRDQLIGGPGALGDVGDFMLENGQVRVIIQDVGYSRGFAIFGGGLLDADLVRPLQAGDSRGSQGKDVFGEMFPAFFIEALDPKEVKVIADGSDGGAARILVTGRGNEFLALTEFMMKTVLDPETLLFETEYALAPGERYVEITSRVINNDPRGRSHEFHNIEFSDTRVPIPMGDALLFNAKTDLFIAGDGGFEQRLVLDERYGVPIQLPALPGLVTDFIAARGDDVSYGLQPAPSGEDNFVHKHRHLYQDYPGVHSDHSMVIPFTASSLMPSFYAFPPDLLGPDEVFEYKRYFIIGSGDVATVRDTAYELLDQEVGKLSGRVLERPSLAPVAGASVMVLDQAGNPINQIDTDERGNFRCSLAPGVYRATVVHGHRRLPTPEVFAVKADVGTYLELALDAPARIAVTVNDDQGRRIPARVTLVGVSDERDLGLPTHESLYHAEIGEPFRYTDMIPDTADPATRRFIEAVFIGHDGTVTGEARPGRYDVYVSRGPEYSVSLASVELKPDQVVAVAATLSRHIDTRGYISGDFHIHSEGSLDSAAWLRPRIIDAAAEGLELAVSTDHNYVTDFAPTIAALDLEQWLTSMIGIELTTLELGHFNAFPLDYQIGPITHGSFSWAGKTADEIFSGLRDLGDESTIVQVNHPRDTLLGYFYQFRFDNETMQLNGQSGLIAPNPETHPEFAVDSFSWDFDAIEVLNGKHLEQVHNYRVPEVLPPPPLPAEVPAAGELLRDEDGAVAFFGAADDWLALLEAGMVYTAIGNSDSHKLRRGEIGYPRTYVGVPDDRPASVSHDDVMAGLRRRDAIMTYCPFVRMRVGEVGIGGTAEGRDGRITVSVDVQTTTWCRPDVVNLYVGRELAAALPIPPEDARRFRAEVELDTPLDTFVVAEVVGTQSTFPILPGNEVPSMELNKALSSLSDSIGFAFDSWGNLRPQRRHYMSPYALTNPIFIDADGDGEWAPVSSASTPLSDADGGVSKSGGALHAQRLLPADAKVDHPYFHVSRDAPPSDLRRLMINLSCE